MILLLGRGRMYINSELLLSLLYCDYTQNLVMPKDMQGGRGCLIKVVGDIDDNVFCGG